MRACGGVKVGAVGAAVGVTESVDHLEDVLDRLGFSVRIRDRFDLLTVLLVLFIRIWPSSSHSRVRDAHARSIS